MSASLQQEMDRLVTQHGVVGVLDAIAQNGLDHSKKLAGLQSPLAETPLVKDLIYHTEQCALIVRNAGDHIDNLSYTFATQYPTELAGGELKKIVRTSRPEG